ncbi:MAG: CpsD/CapB family tyrosine-protein kinase [Planctomycetota bacterium]
MTLFGHAPASGELRPAPPDEGREIPITREELVVHRDPHSQIAEQYRRLRNSLQALNPDGAARSILLTSSLDGEGKTVSALNLGLAIAELPQLRVLVVDADLRRPAMEELLGLPRRLGLCELLTGRLNLDQAIRPTAVARFDVVGPGEVPGNIAEVLNLDRIRAVLNAMKRRYDYVLIDSPPVLTMNHPSVLGSLADGVLLVVRLGKTPKPLVEEAFRMLENLGGNVLGTCVTGSSETDLAG